MGGALRSSASMAHHDDRFGPAMGTPVRETSDGPTASRPRTGSPPGQPAWQDATASPVAEPVAWKPNSVDPRDAIALFQAAPDTDEPFCTPFQTLVITV